MTQDELRELMRDKNEKSIHPLIEKMTLLLCEAYETGFNVGIEISEKLHQAK